ncbi:MAG: hypothetical protein ACLRPU_10595, partial [Enterococcus hulanensis]
LLDKKIGSDNSINHHFLQNFLLSETINMFKVDFLLSLTLKKILNSLLKIKFVTELHKNVDKSMEHLSTLLYV